MQYHSIHWWVSFFVSVINVLFSVKRPFTSMLKFISKYFVVFLPNINVLCIFSLISFSDSLLLVYRNATARCTFIFYPTTLLNSLIRPNRVVFIVFRISICHLQIETVLTSPFPIFMPMISLSCLMVLLGLRVLY